MFKSTRIHL